MNIKNYILLLLISLVKISAFSQDNIEFIENKGQWDAQVKYMGKVAAGEFYIMQDGITVVQHNPEQWGKLHDYKHEMQGKNQKGNKGFVLNSHAYRMRFLNANASPKIIADKPLPTYNNYFIGNDPSKWASECKVYQGITIKDVYPGIDARYYSNGGTLKYDLIVSPGATITNIALQYEGAEKIEIKNKELVIKTSVGELKELSPYSFQYDESGKNEVSVKYSLKGNIVRFDAKKYNTTETLIIDPSIIFSSFTGSTSDNWGFSATYGPDGSMYGGGIVFFSSGFPASPGAFQTTFAGGNPAGFSYGPFDIGIMKLSPDGTSRIYSTYIGGSGNEMPQSLIVDGAGNLIIAGRSDSPNYPGQQVGVGGLFDITLTKLNANGSALIGSKKIGGTADDGANINQYGGGATSLQQNYGDEARSEVNMDAAGNIYLASCTQSSNFPTTGGFQSTNNGAQDGVVIKMTPDLSTILFSTYFGGAGNDAAYVLSLHPQNNTIYIAGGTESNNLPGSKTNTISPNNNGSIDGFVSMISNDGSSIIKTTYLGTAATDQIFGIQFDNNSFPYVMGQTRGTWPVTPGVWSQAAGKQFISKLQPDLSAFVYSTVFGTGGALPNISPVAFLVDRCENVYISGWGGDLGYPSEGTKGLTVTPDAFKSVSDDAGDFYFFVLKKDATAQLFGSFYGKNGGLADHVDGGTSRFDSRGVIYQAICADCKGGGGGNFPTTPGVWAPTNPSSNCNLAMLKINLDLSGVDGQIQSTIKGVVRDTAGCIPLMVNFKDTIQAAESYIWDFGDGSPRVTTTNPDISHTYNSAGSFNVMLIAVDLTKCFTRDTSYLTIKVSDLVAQLDFNSIKLNPCSSFRYQFDNTSIAPASKPFTSQSFIWDFGDGTQLVSGMSSVTHTYTAPGTYNVKLILKDSSYCNNPDSLMKTIRVASEVKAAFDPPPVGCAPYNVQFNNTSTGGSQFIWNFGDGTGSNAIRPTHTFAAGTYTVTLLAIDSATCNIADSISFSITVFDNPTADFATTPQPPLTNTPITFTNLSSLNSVRYKWEFGDGDSLLTVSRNPVMHDYSATTNYSACLTAYNAVGCSDKLCKQVTTLIEPAVDVPNAFTPASGDVNSKIFVRGYGFAKIKFIVWARWGEKVFETEDKNIGWDGIYKGKMLPMDVYAYTLDVEFSDGTKVRKKGDITLIR